MADVPVACTLSSEDMAARRDDLLPGLIGLAIARKELEEGASYQFAADADLLTRIARTIDAERQCCRFLRFALVVEPDGGMVTLTVTGPPGTREVLRDLSRR